MISNGRLFLIAAILATFLLSNCAYENNKSDTLPAAGRETLAADDASDDAVSDDADDRPNVTEYDDIGAQWQCGWPSVCVWDYFHFLDLAQPYAVPVPEMEVLQEIADVENGLVDPLTDSIPADQLCDAILDILNIRFLVDGLDERPLTVVKTERRERAQFSERHLLIIDPYVGTFEAILLVPHGRGPFPAVVAVHGHRDDAGIYMRRRFGHLYPQHGYAILMLTMRGMGIDIFEHEASRRFLVNGFALIGMRVYESLLGLKYLRYLPEIDNGRIGLIGHSGGSSTGNLTIRIENRFAAYVSDLAIDYSEWGTLFEPWHCETVPKLFPYNLLIQDFSTSAIPVKEVPYAYTNGPDEIFDFYDRYLK